MSEEPTDPRQSLVPDDDDLATNTDRYGSLSIEDDPAGTVDPGELAGSAGEQDDTGGPAYSEADDQG